MLIETPAPAVEYPESDGQPMGETGIHVRVITDLYVMLRAFFRHRPDVYVGADMFMYYVEGDPKKVVSPDVFVAFGVADARVERRSFFIWREGKAPDVIFEVTSESTRNEDTEFKKGLYAQLGVQEYFLFDPLGDYLQPTLQGFRSEALAARREGLGEYRPITSARGELVSQVLGLALRVIGGELQLFDRATGTRLLPPPELAELNFELRAQLEVELAARREAESELARLRAELARLKGESPQ